MAHFLTAGTEGWPSNEFFQYRVLWKATNYLWNCRRVTWNVRRTITKDVCRGGDSSVTEEGATKTFFLTILLDLLHPPPWLASHNSWKIPVFFFTGAVCYTERLIFIFAKGAQAPRLPLSTPLHVWLYTPELIQKTRGILLPRLPCCPTTTLGWSKIWRFLG